MLSASSLLSSWRLPLLGLSSPKGICVRTEGARLQPCHNRPTSHAASAAKGTSVGGKTYTLPLEGARLQPCHKCPGSHAASAAEGASEPTRSSRKRHLDQARRAPCVPPAKKPSSAPNIPLTSHPHPAHPYPVTLYTIHSLFQSLSRKLSTPTRKVFIPETLHTTHVD